MTKSPKFSGEMMSANTNEYEIYQSNLQWNHHYVMLCIFECDGVMNFRTQCHITEILEAPAHFNINSLLYCWGTYGIIQGRYGVLYQMKLLKCHKTHDYKSELFEQIKIENCNETLKYERIQHDTFTI